ncbi:MAG: hypothetical protein WCO63_10445 [Bacteroidota bacterium]
MTTIIIDESSKEGKALLEFLRHTKYARIVTSVPNATTRKAMRDVENGKTFKCKDAADLFMKLRS